MKNLHDVIIVGSGLTGLSVCHFLKKIRPELDIVLLEKTDRPGGAIQSFRENGLQAEWGPHGFLNNCQESQELLDSLGLLSTVQLAPLGNFTRYLCRNGKITELPQHPGKFIASPLLSPIAKLRILGDLFIKPLYQDQDIAQWAARRFGKAILPLVDAAVTGTYAGDFQRLSIDSVMPGVRELEKKHGSVFKGMRHKRREGSQKKAGLPAMQNFPRGMEQLIETLARDKTIHYQLEVNGLEKTDDLWHLKTSGDDYAARHVVLALPVNPALQLLSPLASPPVTEIPVARIANVVMEYGADAEIPNGFGYLAPDAENRFCLGVMFSSVMFPDRTPGATVLLEALVGGRRHPERLELDDEEIIKRTAEDLSSLLRLPSPPIFSKVLRPEAGIPQLEMDHPSLLAWRQNVTKKFASLHITGFGWDGIGMNEMIKAARETAMTLVDITLAGSGGKDVKSVYF